MDSKIKFYKTVAMPVLLYGSKTCIMTINIENKIQSIKVKFLCGKIKS